MFLKNYVNNIYQEIIFSDYNENFLNSLDEKNFITIYNLFKKYNFYFIDDIILNYLEVFQMEYEEVENIILYLKDKLGDNFIQIIGNDMTHLNKFFENEEDE